MKILQLKLKWILLISLLFPCFSLANSEDEVWSESTHFSTIEIELIGQKNNPKLKVYLALINSIGMSNKKNLWSADFFSRMVVTPKPSQFKVSFSKVSFGDYAVVAFQDLNGNEKLDRNILGKPLEPIAFSNNPIIKKKAPQFSAIKFEVNKVVQKIKISFQ